MVRSVWLGVLVLLAPLAVIGCAPDSEAEGDAGETGETGDTGEEVPVEPYDEFPGLSAEVEIVIDERGIPHIYASSDDDVAYAAGYQMATDRLFQMDLLRRRALGRQAEVLGESFVDQDLVSRTFDLQRWGSLNADRMRDEAPSEYNQVIAWLAGVNARIAEIADGTAPLPYGFAEAGFDPEPWARDDEFAISKLFSLGNSNALETDVLATIVFRNLPNVWEKFEIGRPMYTDASMPADEIPAGLKPGSRPSTLDQTPTPVPMDPFSEQAVVEAIADLSHAFDHVGPVGSNNWAVDGRHTASGRPIIAGDPHQPLQSPSLMYAMHLNTRDRNPEGGHWDAAGFSFAGTFGVQLGHNDKLHWTATTDYGDAMDLWEVRVEDQGVWAGDEYVEWDARTEVIAVAGGEPVEIEMRDIPGYGVIVPASLLPLPVAGGGHELMVNWPGFGAGAEETCFTRMAQAQTLDEWEAGVDLMDAGGFNFVAASAEGISYRISLLVPDRQVSGARLPYMVLDGDDPSTYWTNGYLGRDKLPHSRLASTGWVATANQDPWGFTHDGDVTNDPFYYGFFYASGIRAHRIHDELKRLTGVGDITPDEMMALQVDTHSVLSDDLLPVLAEAVSQISSDPELAEFIGDADILALADQLAGWDQRMDRESSAALVFHMWLFYMGEIAAGDDFGFLWQPLLDVDAPNILKFAALSLLDGYSSGGLIAESKRWIAVKALAKTSTWLNSTYGSVDPAGYTWGAMHGTDFRNPYGGDLYGGWVPTDGAEDTVNVSASPFYMGAGNTVVDRFESRSGPIFRFVTSFAEDGTPEAMVNFPRGNSGDPSSPHWDDTLEDWVEGVYTHYPFTRAEVDAATESTYTLAP